MIAFEIDSGEQYNLLHPVVRRVLLGLASLRMHPSSLARDHVHVVVAGSTRPGQLVLGALKV